MEKPIPPDCLELSEELRALEETLMRKMPDEKTADYKYLTLKIQAARTELELHELIYRYEDTVDVLEKSVACINSLTEEAKHYRALVHTLLQHVYSLATNKECNTMNTESK